MEERVSNTDYYYDRKAVPIYDIDPPFPIEVLLDVTSFCNHRCTFCANPDIQLKTTVQFDTAARFIEESYRSGARRLGIFGTGESFLFKQLSQYIGLAKEIGFEYVYIKTNGALCNRQRLSPVLDAGLDSLRFSIHAGTRESYLAIQGRDDFEQVIENIRQADSYRKEKGLNTEIAVNLVLTDLAGNEVGQLKELVGQHVDVWDIHDLNSQCGNLLDNSSKGTLVQGGPRYDFKNNKCKQPFQSLSLTPEGYVSACIMDFSGDLIVGNYNEQGLMEIWQSEVYRKFRRDHLLGSVKEHICYSCIYGQSSDYKPLMPEYSRRSRAESKVLQGK